MKYVYLLSCTSTKQDYHCQAKDMYMKSNLFRLSYLYCLNNISNENSEIYILSAKYHLLSLSQEIDPYDKTLIKMSKKEKKEWGEIVFKQLKEMFDIKNTHFIFLTGKEYMNPIIPYLDKDQYSNPFPTRYGIGKRMKWLKNHTGGCLIKANKIRNNDYLYKISKDNPGWYKWWAPESTLKLLLNSPYIPKNYYQELLPYLTKKNINGTDYYYIYVGVAIRESIRERLNWHVNQHHTKTSVESGFLSTLRQTLSSLISNNQYDESSTNKIIDTLYIEYYSVNLPIKSEKAKEQIEYIEKEEMNSNVLPLNLRDNKNSIVKDYLKELSKIRKSSKITNK